jgi:acetyltransferase-like isoleucine patch superfamily enzyme
MAKILFLCGSAEEGKDSVGDYTKFNISKKITEGDNCLIAAGWRFIDHNHGTMLGKLMNTQKAPKKEINLEDDVWLGCNVLILKGVHIGEGAAAGSVVTKNIPS